MSRLQDGQWRKRYAPYLKIDTHNQTTFDYTEFDLDTFNRWIELVKQREHQFQAYKVYHGRLGNFRPIVLDNFTSMAEGIEFSNETKELIPGFLHQLAECCSDMALLYDIKQCENSNCYGNIVEDSNKRFCKRCFTLPQCDQCQQRKIMGELSFDAEGNSKCLLNCGENAREKEKKALGMDLVNYIDGIITNIENTSGFKIFECTLCNDRFFCYSSFSRFKGDVCLCWSCFKKTQAVQDGRTEECTRCYCKFRPDEVEACEDGDCLLCVACNIDCKECDRLGQKKPCYRKKKCTGPRSGNKVRVHGRVCPTCKVQKSMCCNSYGHVIHIDDCPHGWCHVCEKHNKKGYCNCSNDF